MPRNKWTNKPIVVTMGILKGAEGIVLRQTPSGMLTVKLTADAYAYRKGDTVAVYPYEVRHAPQVS